MRCPVLRPGSGDKQPSRRRRKNELKSFENSIPTPICPSNTPQAKPQGPCEKCSVQNSSRLDGVDVPEERNHEEAPVQNHASDDDFQELRLEVQVRGVKMGRNQYCGGRTDVDFKPLLQLFPDPTSTRTLPTFREHCKPVPGGTVVTPLPSESRPNQSLLARLGRAQPARPGRTPLNTKGAEQSPRPTNCRSRHEVPVFGIIRLAKFQRLKCQAANSYKSCMGDCPRCGLLTT